MSVQSMGGIFDGISDWWNDNFGSTTDYTDYWTSQYGSGASAGLGSGYYGDTGTSYQTQADQWWKDYSAIGGSLSYNPTFQPTTTTTTADWTSGINDFFKGVSESIGSIGTIFQTGLGAYASVQQLIKSVNPDDQITQVAGTNTYVVRKADGSIVPLAQAYPQFGLQIQDAQQKSQTQTLLLAGALGLGLFLILRKK
jgi:hypothetical protein